MVVHVLQSYKAPLTVILLAAHLIELLDGTRKGDILVGAAMFGD